MEVAVRRRIAKAPPPTPIATGKGLRSAAVDDRVLSRYLETSLRVPDLTLPKPYPSSRSPAPKTLARVVRLPSLSTVDDASASEMIAAAGEVGAFAVDAGGLVAREEVAALCEAGRALGWDGEEKDLVLHEGTEAYRILRQKMEGVTSKLGMIAESIAEVLLGHVKNQLHSAKLQKVPTFICIRRGGDPYKWSEDTALSLHVVGSHLMFHVRSPDSTSSVQSGCILVTVGKQFKEICNGELKSYDGEIFLEPGSDQRSPFSLELAYSLPVPNHVPPRSPSRIVSLMDQLLVLLILVFLYNLCS